MYEYQAQCDMLEKNKKISYFQNLPKNKKQIIKASITIGCVNAQTETFTGWFLCCHKCIEYTFPCLLDAVSHLINQIFFSFKTNTTQACFSHGSWIILSEFCFTFYIQMPFGIAENAMECNILLFIGMQLSVVYFKEKIKTLLYYF